MVFYTFDVNVVAGGGGGDGGDGALRYDDWESFGRICALVGLHFDAVVSTNYITHVLM